MILQPARVLLKKRIQELAPHVSGDVLDIGASGYLRYKHLFTYDTYRTLDVQGDPDIKASIENIPLPAASIDSIVCTQVLGDIFDLQAAFNEMFRILKPNGAAIISEALFWPLHDEPHDFWRFTPHSLRALAERAGFSVDCILPFGDYRTTKWQLTISHLIEIHSPLRHVLNIFNVSPRTTTDRMPLGHVMMVHKKQKAGN